MYRTVLESARGILSLADTSVDPFTELKNRLLELLTLSILDQCTSILWGAELGSRRPTELLEVMMAALPPDELAGHIFKAIFLHRLPGDLKDLVAIQFQQVGVMELAKFADIIWDARNSKKTVVVAVKLATLEEETTLGERPPWERDSPGEGCGGTHHPQQEEVAWQQGRGPWMSQRQPGGQQRRRPGLEISL